MDRIIDKISPLFHVVASKIAQIIFSIVGGIGIAIEATTLFFVPCIAAIGLDVASAVYLSKRINKKHPELSDGKFKSEYKYKVMYTMLVVFVLLIIAHYVDTIVFKEGIQAQASVLCGFLLYEGWSVLENWSSENDNPMAKALQNVMVNKAERHLNVPEGTIGNVLLRKDNDKKKDNIAIHGSNSGVVGNSGTIGNIGCTTINTEKDATNK